MLGLVPSIQGSAADVTWILGTSPRMKGKKVAFLPCGRQATQVRHARACPEHPRFGCRRNLDPRDKPEDDGKEGGFPSLRAARPPSPSCSGLSRASKVRLPT